MHARASVIIVVAAVLAAGCGSHAPTPLARVAAYLNKANAIERQLQAPIQIVDKTIAGSALPQTGGASAAAREREQTLLGAWRSITSLRARLAALNTPAAASRLRALLLQLIDRQASLTLQSAHLVVFLAAFQDALKPLSPAVKRLQAVLGESQPLSAAALSALYARKAAALRSFQAATETLATRVRVLTPPPLVLPAYRTELRALGGMGKSAGQLADALAAGQSTKVPALLSAFDRAASTPNATSSQRAQRAAIVAYDRQVAELSQLEQTIADERLRLANTLQ